MRINRQVKAGIQTAGLLGAGILGISWIWRWTQRQGGPGAVMTQLFPADPGGAGGAGGEVGAGVVVADPIFNPGGDKVIIPEQQIAPLWHPPAQTIPWNGEVGPQLPMVPDWPTRPTPQPTPPPVRIDPIRDADWVGWQRFDPPTERPTPRPVPIPAPPIRDADWVGWRRFDPPADPVNIPRELPVIPTIPAHIPVTGIQPMGRDLRPVKGPLVRPPTPPVGRDLRPVKGPLVRPPAPPVGRDLHPVKGPLVRPPAPPTPPTPPTPVVPPRPPAPIALHFMDELVE